MSAYKVKPAVFDLLLSIVIGGYLFAIYGIVIKSSLIVSKVAKLISASNGVHKTGNGSNGHDYSMKSNGKAYGYMDSPRQRLRAN